MNSTERRMAFGKADTVEFRTASDVFHADLISGGEHYVEEYRHLCIVI